ncbi:MAG: hypothetical protein V1774_08400, partial [Candidatus Eisenbacteria bacterium]
DSRDRLRELSRQVQELHREKDLFLQRFLSFLEGQMQFLRSHENELHEIDTIDARAGDFLAATARKGRPADDLDYASATDESYLVGSGDGAPETETVWSDPPSNQDAAERFAGREESESDLRAPIPERGAHSERPAPRRFAAEPAGPGEGGMSRSTAAGRPGVSERMGAKDRSFSAARSGQFERPSADPARESEAAQGLADGDESGFFNRRAASQGFFERSKRPGADS